MTLRKISTQFTLETKGFVDGVDKVQKKTKSLTFSSKEALAEYEKAFGKMGTPINMASEKVEEHITKIKKVEHEANRNAKAYNRLSKELKMQTAMLSMTNDEQEIYAAQMRLGANATEQQKQDIAELVKQQQGLRKSTGQTAKSMRGMRGASQNLGWQLQDIAVQAQMGTSAFTIFSQQGSQLASSLGAKGALIGAVIAVGGALGGVLYKALGGVNEEMADFAYNAKKMRGDLDAIAKLSKSQAAVGLLETDKTLNKISESLDESSAKVNKWQSRLTEDSKKVEVTISKLGKATVNRTKLTEDEIKTIKKNIHEEMANRDLLLKKYQEEVKAREQLHRVVEGLRTAADTTAIEEMSEALDKEIKLFGRSEKAIAIWEMSQHKATKEEKEAIETKYDKIKALEDEAKAEKDRKALEKSSGEQLASLGEELHLLNLSKDAAIEFKNAKIALASAYPEETKSLLDAIKVKKQALETEKALAQLEKDVAAQKQQAAQVALSNLASLAEEGSALAKAAFIAQQALAANQVIVNYELMKAKMGTFTLTPAQKTAQDALLESQKYMSLGTIAATTIAGVFHDGGGIPDDGTYLMQGGEYVESRAERREIDKIVNNQGGSTEINLNYQIQALDAKGVEQVLMKNRQGVYNAVNKVMNGQGRKL